MIDESPTFLSCLPFSFCPLPQAGSAERRAVRSALCPGACQSWDMQPMACSWTHSSLHQALIHTSVPGGMPWGSALLCFESHSYLYQQSMQRVSQNEREGEERGGQRVSVPHGITLREAGRDELSGSDTKQSNSVLGENPKCHGCEWDIGWCRQSKGDSVRIQLSLGCCQAAQGRGEKWQQQWDWKAAANAHRVCRLCNRENPPVGVLGEQGI